MTLTFLAALVGFAGYIPIFKGIYEDKVRQSFATWLLWGLLDLITALTILFQNGNYLLSFGYAIGSLVITGLLVYKKQAGWSASDTLASILVGICIILWYSLGHKAGTIAGVTALIIASIPQVIETWKKPADTPILPYSLFLAGAIISFIGAHSWTIEERLFPGTASILCLIIILFAMRKEKQKTNIRI